MTIQRAKTRLIHVLAALLLPLFPYTGSAAQQRVFTEDHPLVYEDAWDLWPYSYLDESGQPTGYNIDLVQLLCTQLNIPYTIKLKPTREALEDLKAGRSDLMLGMSDRYHASYAHSGKAIVQLFTQSVVYPSSLTKRVRSEADLRQQKVIVHVNSFSHRLMMEQGMGHNATPRDDMRDVVQEVSSTQRGQILWNTMSLKWLLRKYQISNLQISSVDMAHGEYRFLSTDTVLLARMDSAFAVVSTDYRQMERLQNQWFYPERITTGIPSWVWYTTLAASLLMLVLFYLAVTYRSREHHFTELSEQRTKRLSMILGTNSVGLWTYDVDRQIFSWLDPSGQTSQEQSALEFARRFSREDFDRLCDGLRQVIAKEKARAVLEIEALPTEQSTVKRHFRLVLSVLHSENDRPTVILGTRSDITSERDRQAKAKLLLTRYKSIFSNAMVDMVYFDSEGRVTNMNERAQQTFGITTERAMQVGLNVKELVGNPDFDLQQLDYYYVTRFARRNANGVLMTIGNDVFSLKDADVEFYEMQLVPIYDGTNLLGIYGTGRMVTENVKAYRNLKANARKMSDTYREVTNYVQNIDYVMKVGNVRIVTYSPDTHTLTVYRETNVEQTRLTQSRCMTLVADSQKKLAMRLLNSMDNETTGSIDAEIATTLRVAGRPLYLQFHFIPLVDAQGRVARYFGMCRDVSEIKATESQLERETKRAQEVEELKNSFLRNMSYEIRTPLNAVVGFSELFEMPHEQSDEDIFIKEIKDNAAYLLHLINDILFLSRLDAHMIEFNMQPTDFASTFEGHCQLGWNNCQQQGVRYVVENHYEQLVIDIDDANLGRVIEQICANAAQHTAAGTVRARYDYVGSKLIIAVEDTGTGMSQDQLKRVFQRFGNGMKTSTGLGLPICQELVEQLGGTLELNSEVDRGTTVWITIPCKASAMVRKTEF